MGSKFTATAISLLVLQGCSQSQTYNDTLPSKASSLTSSVVKVKPATLETPNQTVVAPAVTSQPAELVNRSLEPVRKSAPVIIETIRNRPAKQAPVVQQTIQISNRAYSIQIGTFRKQQSLDAFVKKLPSPLPLYRYQMRNAEFLGLIHGRYESQAQAQEAITKLKHYGISDAFVRVMPRYVVPLSAQSAAK